MEEKSVKYPHDVKAKASLLSQFGLTKKNAVRERLARESAHLTDPVQRSFKLDRTARTMLNEFFEGNTDFVEPKLVEPAPPPKRNKRGRPPKVKAE